MSGQLILPFLWFDDPKLQANFEEITLKWPDVQPRAIRGSISALGAIIAGTGFTVTKGAAGAYSIQFVPAFASAPSVVCSCDAAAGANLIALPWNVAAAACNVQTYNGALANAAFFFIAMA